MKTLNHSLHDSRYKKQADNKGRSRNPPLIDPLPTLKEKLLERKCRKLARQLLKREQRNKRKNTGFAIAIVRKVEGNRMAEDGGGEKICSSERAEPDSLIEPEHNFPQPQLLNQSQLKCPQCGSTNLYKDGLRYLSGGTDVQRWLCRNCGYCFTNHKNKARTERKNSPSGLNPPFASYYSCQGNNDPDGRVPPRQKGGDNLGHSGKGK